jgi:type IV secretion system protein VirB8
MGKHTFKGDPAIQQVQLGGTNKVKQERDRAYLLIAFLVILLALSITGIAVLAKIHTVIPVVTTIDVNGHVVKQQVVSQETISGLDSFVESQVHDFITACNTYDHAWRQHFADLCHLHSTEAVAKQYDLETAADNPNNPYYVIGQGARRYPKITAINSLGKNAYQVEFQSITEKPGAERKVEYFTALVRNTFTFQPLALGDRWENPLGFAATSYSKNQKLSNQ